MLTAAKNNSPNGSIFLPTRCTVKTRGIWGTKDTFLRHWTLKFLSLYFVCKRRVSSRTTVEQKKLTHPKKQAPIMQLHRFPSYYVFSFSRHSRWGWNAWHVATNAASTLSSKCKYSVQFAANHWDTFYNYVLRAERSGSPFSLKSFHSHFTVSKLCGIFWINPLSVWIEALASKEVHSGKTTHRLTFRICVPLIDRSVLLDPKGLVHFGIRSH